jgi:DNA-binding MarR family transcriptional regulator
MAKTNTPAEDREYLEAAALREALRAFARRTELATRAAGLTPRIYQLLLMVRTARGGTDGAGLVELEERLQLGKSTVTELVMRCEDRGLVRRELDRNRRRAIRIQLTRPGEQLLGRVVTDLGDERRHLVDLLGGLDAQGSGRTRGGSRS